jgi:hypothetical protein
MVILRSPFLKPPCFKHSNATLNCSQKGSLFSRDCEVGKQPRKSGGLKKGDLLAATVNMAPEPFSSNEVTFDGTR